MTPRRILHCHSTFSPGGKELRAVRLMNAFGDAAHHSILSAVPNALGARDAIAPGIKVDFPDDAPPLQGRIGWRRYQNLARYMRGFDLVLTYNWGAMDAVAARRFFPAGGPVMIHHEDGFNADEADAQFARRVLFRRAVLPAARHVVVPSALLQRLARESWNVPPAQIAHIANGIATRAFQAAPRADALPGLCADPETVIIGTIAGLRPVKNIPRLVRAVAMLGPKCQLVVIGEGPERAAIEMAAQQAGLGARLLMPGHVPQSQNYVGCFDIFALSSDSEQAPIALIEAMAAGLPVVATDVGDVRQMVARENQPFVKPKEDSRGFQIALQTLCRDVDLRRTLGAANQKKASADFDEAQMIEAYARLYGLVDPRAS